MITYQVEVTVPDNLVERWLQYMTSQHIDDVVRTGHFTSAHLTRILESAATGVTTFRVIYTAPSLEALQTYQRDCAPALQAHHAALFGDAVRATRSVTENMWSAALSNT